LIINKIDIAEYVHASLDHHQLYFGAGNIARKAAGKAGGDSLSENGQQL